MIYEYVLVAPPSQSTKYLRVPVSAETSSEMASPAGATVKLASMTDSADPLQLAPEHHARPARVSYLAILQTCRQINREAYHVFYAKNPFHFTDAPTLIAFLRGIGPMRRAEVTSLHLEGLVVDQPLWPKYLLDSFCLKNNIGSVEREEREAFRFLGLHPETLELGRLLDSNNNLSRLIIGMRTHERHAYFLFVKFRLEWRTSVIPVVYLIDDSRWVVRWPCSKEEDSIARYDHASDWSDAGSEKWKNLAEKWEAYTACYPSPNTEEPFPVVVDIIRGPEEALGYGYQSWVAIR